MTEWTRYRMCPVCRAGMGEPCTSISAYPAGPVPMDAPHSRRRERAGRPTRAMIDLSPRRRKASDDAATPDS